MKKLQALQLVLAMLIVTLVGGFSAFAAETPIQVTARLSANTVAIAGTVQNLEVTEIGVLILRKEANFDRLGSDDIVYANQYELDENGAFSFEAELPSADLKRYILQIGGEGLLYRRLLDGSELSKPSSSSSAPQEDSSSSSPSANSSSSSESGSGEGDQQSSGTSSDVSSMASSGTSSDVSSMASSGTSSDVSSIASSGTSSDVSSIASSGTSSDVSSMASSGTSSDVSSLASSNAGKGSGSEHTVNTGDPRNLAVWGIFSLSVAIVLAGIVVMKKKGGSQHE